MPVFVDKSIAFVVMKTMLGGEYRTTGELRIEMLALEIFARIKDPVEIVAEDAVMVVVVTNENVPVEALKAAMVPESAVTVPKSTGLVKYLYPTMVSVDVI